MVNPLRTRLLGEVTAAVDEGTPLDVAEHALDPLGLPMSPFLLLPLVGPAEALHVAETLHEAFPARFAVSPKLRALVKAGKTAVYRPGLTIDPEVAELLAGSSRPSTADEVRQRALAGLAEEIRFMLDEDVVTAPQDITRADPRRGLAVPPRRHHALPDDAGIAEKVNGAWLHGGASPSARRTWLRRPRRRLGHGRTRVRKQVARATRAHSRPSDKTSAPPAHCGVEEGLHRCPVLGRRRRDGQPPREPCAAESGPDRPTPASTPPHSR